MLRDAKLHPDVALVNGISVLLTLLEVRKGRFDYKYISCIVPHILFETLSLDVQNNFDNFKFACFDAYFSGEGEEPMTALDAERLAQGKRTKLT